MDAEVLGGLIALLAGVLAFVVVPSWAVRRRRR